jgi:NADPH-dependent 2,4-dienoyl-CoA reductase/sulfur reductase-like enzyme/nitrite reductase/ring-hydroxylating ferredoxin subunit
MGSGKTDLQGPDLAQGVELADLTEAKPLIGHARGEAIVLVRRGESVCAIGATCSHYGGPLAEGLVVGDTLRCPWHHACFSLDTGEAVRAPALSAIPAYEIVRKGTRVAVGGRKEPPARAVDATVAPPSVVVVGAGAAGAAAVEALRREGYRGAITLLGDEPPGPVDRPNLSKDYLAGTAPDEWIPLRTPDVYEGLHVELLVGEGVERIEPTAHRVQLKGGRALEYGALLLATGARPRRLDVPGADRAHVKTLRTLADSRAIVLAAAGARKIVIVGASFIGLEVAASLRARKLDVTVVAPDTLPLRRVLGDELGRFVQKLHEDHGVRFQLGHKPASIGERSVTLDDGSALDADVVVLGVGVAPRTELAEAAGLRVDNGILVDSLFRTSAADVFAAGDVARYPDPITGKLARIEHWVLAGRQGQAAARSMLGRGAPFTDAPFFWSQHYDVTLSYVGHAPEWDRLDTRGSLDARDFAAAYVRNGRIQAVVTVGRDALGLRAEAAFEAADTAALERLFSEG